MNEAPAQPDSRSVLDLIRGIKDRDVDPTQLSTDDRRDCVNHLSAEGYSVPEIAQILRVSDRTVSRDRAAHREATCLSRDPQLAERMAGQLAAQADLCIARIRRTVRDRETSPATRIDGERACFQILDRLVDRLQSLGFLPTAAQRLDADLNHRVTVLPDLQTIQLQIEDLRRTEQAYGGGNGELQGQLRQLHGVSRLLLAAEGATVPNGTESTGDAEPAS